MRNRRIAIIFVVTAALVTISIVQLKIQQLLKILFVGGLANMISYYFYGSLLQRRIKIFVVAITVFVDYRIARKYDKWLLTSQRKKDAMWERAHERNAKRVYRAIVSLEGLWVKAGQYLSTRADVLPEPYIRRLKLLQDTLPPRPLSEVYATVESELGRKVSEAFASFDKAPLATASIAQVHRATLQDGTDVVVKVQHTGVKQRILQDLANLGTIVEWVAWAEPEYNFRPVLDEWASEVPKELNFVTEAENTRAVAANLDYSSSSSTKKADAFTRVDVLLPSVLQATERVLVMTYMDGVRLGDIAGLDGLGVDKHELVESITRAYAHQIYVDAFFNADPHPGNFLVSREAPYRAVLLDFGLTKRLRPNVQLALAKMLLASAESDYAMLLSSFAEMGLRLRMDMPDDAMAVTSFFFRRAAPPKESIEETRAHFKEREERRKELEEQAKEESGEKSLRRNPVDAFPGELVFFMRVLNLLRGVSSMLGARVAYLDVMRPFAEAILSSAHVLADSRHLSSEGWVRDSPLLGPLDAKVRALLVDLGRRGKMLGMQVCAYKDGRVVVDVAAGVMGKYDPRPVQHSSLFSVFSATKGVAAALVHWLIARRKVELTAPVASVWPAFGTNGKAACTVAHVLTHTAGLENALAAELLPQPMKMCNWADMLARLAAATPASAPGEKEAYHYLTFGWLTGGIVEGATGQPFQQVLQEAFIRPLGVDGEFYIGIPSGVESRLATLALDRKEPAALPQGQEQGQAQQLQQGAAARAQQQQHHHTPSTIQDDVTDEYAEQHPFNPLSLPPTSSASSSAAPRSASAAAAAAAHLQQNAGRARAAAAAGAAEAAASGAAGAGAVAGGSSASGIPSPDPNPNSFLDLAQSASTLPLIFNALFIRRAVIPAANGHFSARALARFYAALGAGGAIPSLPSSSDPPLGSTGRQKQEEDERRKREDEEHAEKQRQKKDRWKVWKRIGPGGSSRTGPSPGGSPATADPQGRTTKPRRDVASPSSAPGSDASRALLDGYVATPGARDPAATAGGGSLFPGSPNPAPGSPHIIDEFVGEGEFQHLCMPGDKFGLGFLKFPSSEQPPRKGESSLSPSPSPSSLTLTPLPSPPSASRRWPAFGHTGMGGSVGFTDPEHGFAIAVTLNQLSAENEAAAAVVRLVCTELGVPVPARYE